MKKLIVAVVLLSLAGIGVWLYFTYGVVKVEPQILEATASRGDITEIVQATGTLEAMKTVQVGSQVSGTVSKMYADYNDVVKEGQIIAQIDPSLLEVQVEIQKAQIARAQTDIDSQVIQLDDAKRQLARTKDLLLAKLATQQQFEAADLAVKTKDAAIESAKKSMIQNQKSLEQAELNVKYCTIRSPIDGVVVQRQADVGVTVQASMTSPQFFLLATDLTQLRLTGGVDEADIGKIRPGQPVSFTVTAYPQPFRGVVDRVRLNSSNQNSVVTYQVVANVANQNLQLRPGMTATLHIVIETAPDVVKIPNQALRFKPTKDMYEALGATPPAAGQRSAGGPATPGAPGAMAPGANGAANPAAGQAGGTGRTRNGRGAQGFGNGAGNTTPLTPDEIAKLYAGRGAAGGRGANGAGRGGGGGRNARTANTQAANEPKGPSQTLTALADQAGTSKIDDLFAPLDRPNSGGSVWTWDPATKSLKAIPVRLGISDGQFTELVAGDIQPNTTKILTAIIVPVTIKPGSNPLMGNQPGRGGSSMTPGGGGGGRGPGGGGGGRGGN